MTEPPPKLPPLADTPRLDGILPSYAIAARAAAAAAAVALAQVHESEAMAGRLLHLSSRHLIISVKHCTLIGFYY